MEVDTNEEVTEEAREPLPEATEVPVGAGGAGVDDDDDSRENAPAAKVVDPDYEPEAEIVPEEEDEAEMSLAERLRTRSQRKGKGRGRGKTRVSRGSREVQALMYDLRHKVCNCTPFIVLLCHFSTHIGPLDIHRHVFECFFNFQIL